MQGHWKGFLQAFSLILSETSIFRGRRLKPNKPSSGGSLSIFWKNIIMIMIIRIIMITLMIIIMTL